jgi:hypothetical protein
LTSCPGHCKYTRMRDDANGNYTRPDFRSMALITIDMQQDFLAGQPFEIPGTSEILPELQKLTVAFRRAKLHIVHMVRLYKSDGSNVDLAGVGASSRAPNRPDHRHRFGTLRSRQRGNERASASHS